MIRVRPPSARWTVDAARWGIGALLRGGLPPEEPEILRVLGGVGWRFEQRLTPARTRLVADEVRRTFRCSARAAGSIVREGQDIALQSRMEAVVLPRMPRAELARIVRVEGSLPAPGLVLWPHAGNVLLLAAALAHRIGPSPAPSPPEAGPPLVVFTGRPSGTAEAPPQGWFARRLAARREEDGARLPVHWETDPAALEGWLARGHCVGAAFDDRIWPAYVRVPFLGRPALLSPDPFALARRLGVPLHAATIRRERDKSSHVVVSGPLEPTLERFLAHVEPFLREHPGHYARWLAECRTRAETGDPPLFVDVAPDRAGARWLATEADAAPSGAAPDASIVGSIR